MIIHINLPVTKSSQTIIDSLNSTVYLQNNDT